MAGWAEFVETWLARAAEDRRLRAIGSGTDVAFTLRSGDDVVWIHLREGVPVAHALDDGFDRLVDVGLTAPAEVWERLWAPVPPPRHQSLFALLSKVPEFAVEGSREALAQHAHAIARLLELGRPPAAGDGASGDSATAGGADQTGHRKVRDCPTSGSEDRRTR